MYVMSQKDVPCIKMFTFMYSYSKISTVFHVYSVKYSMHKFSEILLHTENKTYRYVTWALTLCARVHRKLSK